MSSMQAQSTAQTPSRKTHFRGVRKRSSNRFAAEIRDPQKKRRVWLGTYDSDIEAAHAYDLAARAMKGWKAKTNFPLSYFENPNSILQRATHNNPQPHEEKVVVPSWINSNMVAKAAASSSSSLSQVIFPPELQRQQQLAALKMSNQRRCDESDGVMGVINGRGKESDSPSNSSHPSSSTITECTEYPTTGGIDLMPGVDLNLPASRIDLMAAGDFTVGIDLNLPAPDLERDECGNSCKTLWLFK